MKFVDNYALNLLETISVLGYSTPIYIYCLFYTGVEEYQFDGGNKALERSTGDEPGWSE